MSMPYPPGGPPPYPGPPGPASQQSPANPWQHEVPAPVGRPRRSRTAVVLLAVASALLLLAGLGVLSVAGGSLADQDKELARLRTQQSADAADTVVPAELPTPDLDRAALQDRLTSVTAADKEVEASVKKWVESNTKLSTVWDSLERCMYRVDAYDRLAGRFTAAQLGKLPVKVDVNAPATDCGRAAITKYATGSSL